MKFYKIYIAVSLTVIILLMVVIIGIFIYAGKKIQSESNTVSTKVASFNKNINQINTNLKHLESEIQTQTTNLTNQHLVIP